MPRRPLLLIVCSLLFLYFPFECGWEVARGKPLSWVYGLLNIALPAVMLFGLVRVNRFGWYTLVAGIAFWGVRDLDLYYRETGGTSVALVLHVLIYAISLAYFINPRVRKLYFDPRLRWWRTKPRYETHLPVMIVVRAVPQYEMLRNVSEGGCFIETSAPLGVSERFEINLPLPIPLTQSVLKAHGEVRWVSTQPDKTGMGVLFVNTDETNTQVIKDFVKHQL